VATSFTADPLLPAVQFWAKVLELDAAVSSAPYAQLLQSLLDAGSLLNGRGRGANILLLRVRDWLRELPHDDRSDLEHVRLYLQQTAQDFEAAVRSHRAQAGAETLLLFCPSSGGASSAESLLLRQTEEQLAAALTGVPGLHVASAATFHPLYEVHDDAVHDELRDHIAHIPYHDDYLHVLAAIIVRHVFRRVAPVRKAVVVDCDNTLWKGVVGEVGPEGLEFDACHRALHALLARLADSGVLVCLASKNDEADVWRAFETRPDIGVRRDQVVAAMVNWLPKSQNIRTLAARLNLGLDSFVFIDDSPIECAEVRAGCPEVLTLEWPEDPARAQRLVGHIWELDGGTATREDARRTALYKEEFRRQEHRATTLTFEDFIASLELDVQCSPLAAGDLRRAAQLTLRTNQFNFTTIRREEAEVQQLAAAGRHEIRTVRVKDRFGDYGLVGLVIAERGNDAWTLDTFLLSCRVLGRGVEHQIVANLGRLAAEAGARTVRLRVEATKRNTPARSFVESIIPVEFLRIDERANEADVPADRLAAIRFEPSNAPEVVVEDDSGRLAATPIDGTAVRRRERQIARAAFELATGEAMRLAAQGLPSLPAVAPTPHGAADIASVVHAAFAAALRLPLDTVTRVDRLEALGCDSLRIVEITVALTARFPWLPSTLLFEHTTVSGLVDEIARMATSSDSRVSPAAARASVVRPDGSRAFADVAIVGMGVRCAGASTPDELWDLLSSGRSVVVPVPADRRHFLRPLDDSRSHWAGLLDNPSRFDPEFFGVSPREAEVMDPQLRLFLEVAWAALEDAGALGASHDPYTGVFAGVMYSDYAPRANAWAKKTGGAHRSWESFSLANRISQLFDFHGPSFVVDTACSSSGTALHLACNSLKAGDCDLAIAGGVNLILDPDRLTALGRFGILSGRGICEPFGADADGTVFGEGAGVVVLRPLQDALRRGDRIYGVIKGSGLSTGTGTSGFTAPNPQAQSHAIRRSLQAAGLDPRTISYVETHGTGTILGDPIEVRGLTLAYGSSELQDPELTIDHSCRLGSIKPNIGHLEAGAGVVGLIKILLQFAHRQRVPSRTSAQPNPHIPFAQLPFDVQRTLEDWPQPTALLDGRPVTVPRRAGLSSFGVGGANAHLIVEEAPSAAARQADSLAVDRPTHVLAVSATNEDGLQRQLASVGSFLRRGHDGRLADLGYSLNAGRRHLAHRAAVVGSSREEMLDALTRAGRQNRSGAPVAPPKIAFLFTGQGSQYAGMGRTLYDTQPTFRAALDRCADAFDRLAERPLRDLLFAAKDSPDATLLHQPGYTQPALFAFEYALAMLWQSWGVRADVVMGHSVGEIAAVCVAGGMSLEDGLTLIAARGRLMQALPAGGVMASVMANEARVNAALEGLRDVVAIAAVNTPGQVVISGLGAAVADVSARLSAEGIQTKALTVSHAFHSPLMRPMLAEFERVVRDIRFVPPSTPLVRCIDGVLAADVVTGPEYWLRQVMEPVRFAAGMRTLESDGVTAYVEIGPHPVLIDMGRRCVADDTSAAWLPSLRRDTDEWRTLLGSVAGLYERGADIDWAGFDAPYARRRISAPTYAFGEREYWLPQVPSSDAVANGDVSAPARTATTGLQTYEVAWKPQPTPVRARTAAPWVVFADLIVGPKLAEHLAAQGDAVTVVVPGQSYAESGSRVQIDPDVPEHYERLWASLALSQPRVVHLWNLDTPETDSLEAADIAGSQGAGLASVVHLVHALGHARVARPSVWVVTSGAVAAGTAPLPINVAQAPVWGLGRTIGLEHPDLWGALIDIEAVAGDVTRVARLLAHEVATDSGEDQVAFRDNTRFVPRLVPVSLEWTAPALDVTGAYLVTGGLGALGLHAARWLVAHGARRLVLARRNTAATPAVRSAIAALEAQGATVSVVAADVSSRDAVDALITAATADGVRLGGVIHAAGIDAVIPIASLDAAALANMMGAKAVGAWHLHERTRELGLGLFVTFSSVASTLGAQGRGAYAAANAFLDALAFERRRTGLAATTINWGPWRGGGMASGEQLHQFERIGNRGLDPAAALDVLGRAAGSGRAQVVVADIDWDAFRPVYEARRERAIVASVGGDRPGQPVAAVTQAPWVAVLAGVEPAGREAALVALVQAEVADTLGFDSGSSVQPDRNFYELGVDSLTMADLVGRLKKQVGFSCNALVFDFPNARALSKQLLPRIESAALESPRTSASDVTAPAADAPATERQRATPDPVTRYRPEEEAEVLEFQRLAFPTRQPELIPARWRWMFDESARRLGEAPAFWLYRDGGAIVGQMGSIPVQLKVGSQTLRTGWLVETMVLDSHRAQAAGSRITVQGHEDQPFSLSLGQTAEMREIQYRLGWKQVAPLQIAQRLVKATNVLQGKLPKPAAWAAGLGFKATALVREWMADHPMLSVREIKRFDERHDQLWADSAPDLACAVVRDASYLNWKYVAQPGQTFTRFEIVDGDRVVAVAVWMVREPDQTYRYRRAFLVDLVAPFADPSRLQQIVKAACAAIESHDVDALLCHHVGPQLTRALRAEGFYLRRPERFLLVDTGGLSGDTLATVLSPDAWFVTHGDSDIDRPW
jgi:FkbH-like protein